GTSQGVLGLGRLKRILWLGAGGPLPQLQNLGNQPLTASFQTQRENFHRRKGEPIGFGFARQKLDAPAAIYEWVEIDGGKEDLVYERDTTDNPSESLGTLRPSELRDAKLKDHLFVLLLSQQAIGWDLRAPPRPPFVLT